MEKNTLNVQDIIDIFNVPIHYNFKTYYDLDGYVIEKCITLSSSEIMNYFST